MLNNINNLNKIYTDATRVPLVNPVKKTTKATTSVDKVEISSSAMAYQKAQRAVLDSPDVREDMIGAIKATVDAGGFNISADDIAEKMLSQRILG